MQSVTTSNGLVARTKLFQAKSASVACAIPLQVALSLFMSMEMLIQSLAAINVLVFQRIVLSAERLVMQTRTRLLDLFLA